MSQHRVRQREFARIVGHTLESGDPISRETNTKAKKKAETHAAQVETKRERRSHHRALRDERIYSA